MKIAFLLYPTSKVRVDEDTSFWIMHELRLRRHAVHYFESRHLFWDRGPKAYVYKADTDANKGFLPAPLSKAPVPLEAFDVIFIRKEPPFDNSYLYALHLLELLKAKVFVLNDPRGIAMTNEKLSILHFGDLIPETLVTEDALVARRFIEGLGRPVVVKPLNDKAGSGILSTGAHDKNLSSILDIASGFSKNKIMVQRFIRAGASQDKRILLLNGKVLGVFARKPAASDFRSNLSVGGSMHRAGLSTHDKKIIERTAPFLAQNGLYFVGLDVMGRYLTEINVTSPSGIPEINALYRTRVQEKVADFIESRV